MTALQFLRRSCGSWTSERRYLFAPKLEPVNMTTNFTMVDGERSDQFIIDWTGKTSGQMVLTLDGNVLHRSRDYFGEGANSSKVEIIDQDCVVMRTEYDGCRFREEVRLIEDDFFRLRQTVGYNLKTGRLALCGQYFEARL